MGKFISPEEQKTPPSRNRKHCIHCGTQTTYLCENLPHFNAYSYSKSLQWGLKFQRIHLKKKIHSLPINAYICEKAAKVCAEI